MDGISFARGEIVFKNHDEILKLDQQIRSGVSLNSVLGLAKSWYNREVSSIKEDYHPKISFQTSFMYSKVGKVCGEFVDLIKKKSPDNKKSLLEWLLNRSDIEFLAGNTIQDNSFDKNLNHQFKCYGFSADCDKEVGYIHRYLGDISLSINYLEKAARKYKVSLITAQNMIDKNLGKFNSDSTKKYIAYTNNHIANIYFNLFLMTHDFGYLILSKDYNEISEKNFRGRTPGDVLYTRKNINEGFRILKNGFELD